MLAYSALWYRGPMCFVHFFNTFLVKFAIGCGVYFNPFFVPKVDKGQPNIWSPSDDMFLWSWSCFGGFGLLKLLSMLLAGRCPWGKWSERGISIIQQFVHVTVIVKINVIIQIN